MPKSSIPILLAAIAVLLALNLVGVRNPHAQAVPGEPRQQAAGGVNGWCCFADGTCDLALSQSQCLAQGGYFNDGSNGGSCICTGACCTASGDCLEIRIDQCADRGGVWHGFESRCVSFNCDDDFARPVGISTTTYFSNPLTFLKTTVLWSDGRVELHTRQIALCGEEVETCSEVIVDGPCSADLDLSGDVGFNDLVTVLAAWGPCPE